MSLLQNVKNSVHKFTGVPLPVAGGLDASDWLVECSSNHRSDVAAWITVKSVHQHVPFLVSQVHCSILQVNLYQRQSCTSAHDISSRSTHTLLLPFQTLHCVPPLKKHSRQPYWQKCGQFLADHA